MGQPQSTGLQLGGVKQTTTAGGGLQLGQNPNLLLGTQQGQPKLQPTSGGLQLGQQPSTASQGVGLQLGNLSTAPSAGLQLGSTSGVPTLNLQTAATSKTGQTGLQLGGLGQQRIPPSSITSQPQKTTGISLTGGISLGSSTGGISLGASTGGISLGALSTGVGTTGLSIGKPPPSYTAPSSTGPSTVIPATSISSSAPTGGGKKYTYKQLEKMINEVSLLILLYR